MAPQASPQSPIERLAALVSSSLVRIGKGWGRGGGFVLADGYVVTNAHNLRDRTTTARFAGGREAQASAAGIDTEGDLVVLHVDTDGAPALRWEPDRASLGLGEQVACVGLLAEGGVRATTGAVSATGRTFRGPTGRPLTGVVEHTAALARGSSGTPLLDLEGRLVGINTHRMGEGFYLSLPSDRALFDRLDGLRRGESPQHRRLGVALVPPPAAKRLRAAVGLPDRDGLLVHQVEHESPAQRAGLRQGDLIVSAGGRPMRAPADLYEVLSDLPAGTLALVVLRGNDEVALSVDAS